MNYILTDTKIVFSVQSTSFFDNIELMVDQSKIDDGDGLGWWGGGGRSLIYCLIIQEICVIYVQRIDDISVLVV